MTHVAISLANWARSCDTNKEKLIDAYNAAIAKLLEDPEGTSLVTSTMANGVSVSFNTSTGISLSEWIRILQTAIDILNGVSYSRTKIWMR